MVNKEQLEKLHIDPVWEGALNTTFDRFDISTPLRMAAFIGQVRWVKCLLLKRRLKMCRAAKHCVTFMRLAAMLERLKVQEL